MTKREYLKALRLRNSLVGRLGWIGFILIGVAALLLLEVKNGILFPIPPQTADYMLRTGPISFSAKEFAAIVIPETGNQALYRLLLGIYWCYFASLLLAGPIFLVQPVSFVRRWAANDYRRGLLNVIALKVAIERFDRKGTMLHRWRLRLAIYLFPFYRSVGPIYSHWFEYPEHQWFHSSAIRTEERLIMKCLRDFLPALQGELQRSGQVCSFLSPLFCLERFFLRVARRSDELWRRSETKSELDGTTERDILLEFARRCRPLLIRSAVSPDKFTGRTSATTFWIRQIFSSEQVKYAFGLSAVAAVIMLLGVFAFKIDPSQAFLTWFTVTFGSLTISVGVSAFSLARIKHRSERGPAQRSKKG